MRKRRREKFRISFQLLGLLCLIHKRKLVYFFKLQINIFSICGIRESAQRTILCMKIHFVLNQQFTASKKIIFLKCGDLI